MAYLNTTNVFDNRKISLEVLYLQREKNENFMTNIFPHNHVSCTVAFFETYSYHMLRIISCVCTKHYTHFRMKSHTQRTPIFTNSVIWEKVYPQCKNAVIHAQVVSAGVGKMDFTSTELIMISQETDLSN